MNLNRKSFAAFWRIHGHRWYRNGYMSRADAETIREIIEAWEEWKGAEQLQLFKGCPS